MMSRWAEIRTLYRWELRSALRERSIVINSILLPILLYPGIMWLAFTGISFVRGQTADMASRVAIEGTLSDHPRLEQALRQDARFATEAATPDDDARLRTGQIDARLVIEPHPLQGLPDNVRARVVYDASRERSSAARQRLVDVLRQYRDLQLRTEAAELGVPARDWAAFALDNRNIASSARWAGSSSG